MGNCRLFLFYLMILCGDALTELKKLDASSIDCCVTSPPYYNLRDYGVEGQLGRENTLPEYIDNLLNVFDEVKRCLKPTGTLWVNMGDCYAHSGHGATTDPNNCKETYVTKEKPKFKEIYPPKCLMLTPERFAIGMVDRKWVLRNVILWHKKSAMPSSVKDRFTIDFEYVYFFVKSQKYYFNQQFEPYASESIEKLGRAVSEHHKTPPGQTPQGIHKPRDHKNMRIPGQVPHGMHKAVKVPSNTEIVYNPKGRNMRTLWQIGRQTFKGAHFATYPQALVRRCLDAGCPEGGTVLDPFLGSGSTLLVAQEKGLAGIGIELNPEYVKIANERLR